MLIKLEDAARRVGLTTDQLKITRQRGLPPGNLGRVINGTLLFEEDDLLPRPRTDTHSMANSRLELVEAATARGILVPSSWSKARILEELNRP